MNKKFYIADYCIIHVRKISNSQIQKIIINTECKKNILKLKFLKGQYFDYQNSSN